MIVTGKKSREEFFVKMRDIDYVEECGTGSKIYFHSGHRLDYLEVHEHREFFEKDLKE